MAGRIVDELGRQAYVDANNNLRVALMSGATAAVVAVPSSDGTGAQAGAYVNSQALLYDPGTGAWVRQKANYDTTTGDTGTKIASFTGAQQANSNARGAYVTIVCGTVSGTSPTLAAQLQWSPDSGTTWFNLGPALANLTTTGDKGTIIVYPTNLSQAAGATPANLTTGATQTTAINAALPRSWRINYTIGGTTPSFAITAVYVNYIL